MYIYIYILIFIYTHICMYLYTYIYIINIANSTFMLWAGKKGAGGYSTDAAGPVSAALASGAAAVDILPTGNLFSVERQSPIANREHIITNRII